MDRWKLVICTVLVATAAGTALAAPPNGPARWNRIEFHTKAEAERDVLRVIPARWGDRRIRMLIDRRTGLLKNNVQVVCGGRGIHSQGQYHHFVCTVRDHLARQRLVVSYRALATGRFRIHWLALRRT